MKIFSQVDIDIINDKMRQIKTLVEDTSIYADNITKMIRKENIERITCLTAEIAYVIQTQDGL